MNMNNILFINFFAWTIITMGQLLSMSENDRKELSSNKLSVLIILPFALWTWKLRRKLHKDISKYPYVAPVYTQTTITFGIYARNCPYGGRRLGNVRDEIENILHIPPDAEGFIRGTKTPLPNNYIIQEDDIIDYHRQLSKPGYARSI